MLTVSMLTFFGVFVSQKISKFCTVRLCKIFSIKPLKEETMKIIDVIAMILLVIGGLNWGLVGAADMNLVEKIFGMGGLTKLIYVLVGISALYEIFFLKSIQNRWKTR